MKVLHLSSERSWRGGEQQMVYLIEESEKYGVESHVASKKGSAFSDYCKNNEINFVELGFKNELDVFTARKIKKYCTEHKIDLVHIHSSHSHAMAVWSSVLGNKVPLLLSRKVDFPIKNNVLSKWKFNHHSIQKIICVSDAIKQILNKDLKNKNLCSVVHDGIDKNRFHYKTGLHTLRKEFSIPDEKRIVANISAIAPHKHYKTFVDTVALVIEKDIKFHFFIIGDGPSKGEIENYIKEKGLNNHITLTGFRNDIPDLITDLDLFLMTSETEGLGSTLLDAAINRIPIVSTNAGGIPEFVEHNKNGLLADVYDSEKLASHTLNLVKDQKLKDLLVENGYNKVMTSFTKEVMAKKTIDIYEQVIAN